MIILVPISPARNQQVQVTGVPVLCTHVDGGLFLLRTQRPQRAGSAPTTTTMEKNYRIRELRSQDSRGAWSPRRDSCPAPRAVGQDDSPEAVVGGYCRGDENFVNMCNDMCNESLKAEGGLLTQQSLELRLVDLILRPPHGSG